MRLAGRASSVGIQIRVHPDWSFLTGDLAGLSVLRYKVNGVWEHALGEAVMFSCVDQGRRPPNGSDVKLRGQGPRGYGSASRRLPAFEGRDAGGVTPRKLR